MTRRGRSGNSRFEESTTDGAVQRFPSPGAAATIEVLKELSASPEPLHLRQLAQSLQVPRSTLHRVIQTLEAKGMVRRVDNVGYVLGDETRQLGMLYRLRELPRLADPILHEIHRQTGETVNLAILDDDDMLIVASVQSVEPLRTASWVGKRDRLHASALGKSYMAALTHEALERLLDRISLEASTERTITDREALLADVRATRDRGFALDDEESVAGIRCIAAAVLGERNQVVAALSVSAPATRLAGGMVDTMGTLVTQAADGVSGLLRPLRLEPLAQW